MNDHQRNSIKQSFLWSVSGGVLGGVLVGLFVSASVSIMMFVVVVLLMTAFFLFVKKEKTLSVVLLFFAGGMVLGLVRTHLVHISPEHTIPEGHVEIEGTVARDPEERLGRIEYILRDITYSRGDEEHELGAHILMRGDLGTRFQYGDRVTFSGTFAYPENFETDTGRTFDYEGYLRKDDILGVVSFAKGEYVGEGEYSRVVKGLFAIKHVLATHIEQVVPVPESILALGLLLGERGSFPQNITDAFRTAGLIHIVVLSGYNIAIIAEYTIFALRKKFKKALANSIAALFIILFAILVGGGATVIRASIMGLLVLLARMDSRRYSITRALTFAVVLMILYNPLTLTLDVSFHLSILATLGLIYVAPVLEPYLNKVPEAYGLREIIGTTFSTQIFVLPYLIYKIGEVSLIAPIANIFVLPVIPFIMFLSFCAGVLGIVWNGLAYVISFVLTPMLSYVLFVTQTAASLPSASFVLPPISFVFTCVLYMVLGSILWKLKQKTIVHQTRVEDTEGEEYEIVEFEVIKN